MDAKAAAIRARNLLTEQSEAAVNITLPKIRALIPTALETWSRLCFESREKRELFKTRFLAVVTDGLLDLTPYLDGSEGRINLKELRETIIYSDINESESEIEDIVVVLRAIPDCIVSGAGPITISPSPENEGKDQFSDDDIGRVARTKEGAELGEITAHDSDLFTITTDGTNGDGTFTATIHIYEFEARDNPTPYTWLNSQSQLNYPRPAGSDAPACFLDGRILRTRSRAASLQDDDLISFTVTNFPGSVTEIPFTLEQDFIQFLALTASRELKA